MLEASSIVMEEQNEIKANVEHTLQLLDAGCSTIAVGCPFCSTMITDGVKDQVKEKDVLQLDVAELRGASVVF